ARAVDVGGPGLDEVHVVAAELERARRAGRVDVDLAELVVADQARVHVIAVGVEPDRARAGAAAQRPGWAGVAPGALRARVALRPLGAGRPGVALGPCGSGGAGLAARARGAGVGRRGRSERAAPEVLGQQRVVFDLARRDRVAGDVARVHCVDGQARGRVGAAAEREEHGDGGHRVGVAEVGAEAAHVGLPTLRLPPAPYRRVAYAACVAFATPRAAGRA